MVALEIDRSIAAVGPVVVAVVDGLGLVHDRRSRVPGPLAVRGPRVQRYHGKRKLFGNLELRTRILRFRLFGAATVVGLVAFVDAGRTGDLPSSPSRCLFLAADPAGDVDWAGPATLGALRPALRAGCAAGP